MKAGHRRTLGGRVHLVGKSLLVIMGILLVQSVCSLFLPGEPGQLAGSVDAVVRTSAAGIFGYILGARFARVSGRAAGGAPATGGHMLELDGGEEQSVTAVRSQIGFAQESGAQSEAPESGAASVSGGDAGEAGAPVQVLVTAFIGLFCLISLLVLRNLTQLGVIPEPTGPVVATVTQFRDFVSGCVGFLISSPTTSSDPQS